MHTIRERISRWLIIFLVLFFTNLPYLYAIINAGDEFAFGGFLLNPLDGNTYLAKMYQGWRGDWLFTLPYSPDPGGGAFLNMFYIFLGHVSRITGFSLMATFHATRVLGSVAALLLLMRFYDRYLPKQASIIAFALAAIGSGLGWLTIPFDGFTSDFWVAEAYPFLANYANAHFPWGMCLILWLLLPRKIDRTQEGFSLAIMSFLLALIAPFGVAIVIMVWLGSVLSAWILNSKTKQEPNETILIDQQNAIRKAIWIGIGGVPILIYDFWVVRAHPVLVQWNTQNITPSPPFWDLLISFSPLILISGHAVWRFFRKRDQRIPVMYVWAVGAVVLMYIPFGLQRRFIHGLYIPLAGLAAWSFHDWLKRSRKSILIVVITFLLILPTNVVVLLSAKYGVDSHDSKLFLAQNEIQALRWIEVNTQSDALILASPDFGLFIPAQTGRRVIFGHPFESINAEQAKMIVSSFYSSGLEEDEMIRLLNEQQVDYVIWGPRERSLGNVTVISGLVEMYDEAGVAIYAWGRE